MPRAPDWFVWQLADSAFPAGGFAHSAGLEAAVQLGEVQGEAALVRFAEAALWQAGTGFLPFARAAHGATGIGEVAALDARCHAFLTSHVANRASRTQGRAWAATCARSFDDVADVASLDEAVRAGQLHGHFAPILGRTLAALGVGQGEAQALALHLVVRGVLSAAVRLGQIGPQEAQRLQRGLARVCDDVLAQCAALGVDDVAQTAPIVDLVGALQDRLYSRLFQS